MKEQVLLFLGSRAHAYRQVFDPENTSTKAVLGDLAKFCRADQSCYHSDARASALLEGRREVWLRIKNHLNLSDEELYEIFQEGRKK